MAVDLTVPLARTVLPNPVIAASGTFGHGAELAKLCPPSGVGAITAKSVTAFAWPGNPPRRVAGVPGGGMINSVGLTGPGVLHWIASDLPELRGAGARVIASIWGRTVDEFAQAAAPLRGVASQLVAVEANVSCPNLEDRSRMFAHAPDATAEVTRAVVAAVVDLPVFVKLSPNVTDLREVASAAIEAGAHGLTLVNTLLGLAIDVDTRRPTLGGGGGGVSGPPLLPVALRAVHDVHCAHPQVQIIGTGGVSRGVDAVAMLMAGASAVGVGTATLSDPRAIPRIISELETWCEEHEVGTVKDLVGALKS